MNTLQCFLLLLCTVHAIELLAGPKSRVSRKSSRIFSPLPSSGSPYLQPNRTITCPSRFSGNVYMPCGGDACGNDGECICGSDRKGHSCGYQLRSRKTAFTLSFLLGNWGAGLLYLGLVGMGITKLIVIAALMIAPCIPLCCMCVSYESRKLRVYYQTVLVLCAVGMTAIFGWWIADWLYILEPTTKDFMGYPLVADL